MSLKTSFRKDNPILQYWDEIQSGRIKVCKKIYYVYKKLVDDMNNVNLDWEYNEKYANHAIEFIERFCKHSKGKKAGKKFQLELFQKALIAAIFGFVHKIDQTRKYKEVFLVIARKNGKSTLAAAIGLYMMIAVGEAGAEVYAVATKKDQAKIIWLESKRMVLKSTHLNKKIKCLVSELNSEYNDSTFKPLGSDSDTLDGLNVSCGLFDEIHAWKDKALYDVVSDGTSSRDEALIFIVTTAGLIREGIYDVKYEEAQLLIQAYMDGNDPNPEMLPIIYELDQKAEWTDPDAHIKANPGLFTIKVAKDLQRKVMRAQSNPQYIKNLLCKDFNIPETSVNVYFDLDEIVNKETFELDKLKPRGRYGIAGVDLSKNNDLTVATVIFKTSPTSKIYMLQMYFLPEEVFEKRIAEDKIHYDIWREKDLLTVVPGAVVDTSFVTKWFLKVQNEYDIFIWKNGYDAWSATYWVEEMNREFGDINIPIWQGFKTLSLPMMTLAGELRTKNIIYNNHPIFKWCCTNVTVKEDENGNIKPIKGTNQRKRIDGFASLLNAYTVYLNNLEEYNSIL